MMKLIGEWWSLLGRAFVPVFVSVTVLSLAPQLIQQLTEKDLSARGDPSAITLGSFAFDIGMFMWTAAVFSLAVHACLDAVDGRMMLDRSLGVLLRRIPKIISATLLLLGVLFAVSFVVVLFIGGTDLLGSRLQRLAVIGGLIVSLVLVAARYLLLPAVMMVEGVGGWSALSRSARLARSRQLEAIGLLLLFVTPNYAAIALLDVLGISRLVRTALGLAISGIWMTSFAAAVAIFYVKARAREAEAARADQPAEA